VLTTQLAVDLGSLVIKIKDPDYAEKLLHFPKSPVCQGKTRGRVRTTDHVEATSQLLFIGNDRSGNRFFWDLSKPLDDVSIAALEQCNVVSIEDERSNQDAVSLASTSRR